LQTQTANPLSISNVNYVAIRHYFTFNFKSIFKAFTHLKAAGVPFLRMRFHQNGQNQHSDYTETKYI